MTSVLLWAGEVGDLTEKTHELIFFDFILRDNSKESLEEKNILKFNGDVQYIFTSQEETLRFYFHLSCMKISWLCPYGSEEFFPPTSIDFANYSVTAVLKCLLSLLYLVILRYCMYSVWDKESMFFTEWKCMKSDMTDDRS